ncbi:MAG: EVE domain-containing protein [Ignavibacteriales bacterium]|nr:EVE domain-containing protein [Ignavibacteriales bacterium]
MPDEETSVWIFQGNPERYDILNALSDKKIGNTIHWLVNQHKNKIKKGHMGLLWMAGKESGIYALVRIETDPKMLPEYPEEKKYWLSKAEKEEAVRVELSIIRRLINNPLLKKTLLKIPELSTLSILRQFQGTNFPVTDKEWNIINQLL